MARGQPEGEQVYQPEVMPEDFPRKLTPEIRSNPLVAGVEGLANDVAAKYKADSATWAGNQLADLRIKMMQDMEQQKTQAAPGAQGFTGTVIQSFDKQAKSLTQLAGNNPDAVNALTPGLRMLRDQFADDAIKYEAVEGVKYRANSAKETTDKLASIAAQRPDQFGDLMGQALTQINGANLTPDARLELSKYAQSTLAKSAVEARAQADPYGTMTALLKPEDADAAIHALDPAERQTLLQKSDMLLHQRVADAERVESMQEKRERENSSAALTSLIVKSRSPEGITTADVLQKAPLFRHEPAALEAALNLASGKTVETDVTQFAPRFAAALDGEDQREWALGHVGRDLSEADFEKLTQLGDKGLPNAVNVGVKYIDNAMKPGILDRYNPVANQSHANAMDAFYEWSRKNPQATPEQASGYAKMLVTSYSLVNLQNTTLALPMPQFAVGGRSNLDPDATSAKTAQAEKTGAISHQEAIRQMGIIAKWRRAIEQAQANQAAQAVKAK
jgi:hypothetical protein